MKCVTACCSILVYGTREYPNFSFVVIYKSNQSKALINSLKFTFIESSFIVAFFVRPGMECDMFLRLKRYVLFFFFWGDVM